MAFGVLCWAEVVAMSRVVSKARGHVVRRGYVKR